MTRDQWWVVTDLDGTLMDHSYCWEAAASAISSLQNKGIPIIPCTSKTAEEVRLFRRQAGLTDPFIVENGGAIHGQSEDGEEWSVSLGPSHRQLRPELDALSAALGEPLLALEDLSASQGKALLGLEGDALLCAQRRQWSVPFVPVPLSVRSQLRALAEQRGLALVEGNRMSHLLGKTVSKGAALQQLRLRLNSPDAKVLGLGDSPNDLPLLEAADIAVVVPGPSGPHPAFKDHLASGRYQLAPLSHASGWAEAVKQLF